MGASCVERVARGPFMTTHNCPPWENFFGARQLATLKG